MVGRQSLYGTAYAPPAPALPAHDCPRILRMIATLARLALPAWVRSTRPPRGARAIAEAQGRIRRRLVRQLAPCAIGRQLGLAQVAQAPDQERAFRDLPITEYGDYEALIQRTAAGEHGLLHRGRTLALAQTSGTTRNHAAGERFIPQNGRLLRHHRMGGAASLARALEAAGAQTLAGRLLMVGGSSALDNRHAVPMGDLSGIAAARLPPWIRNHYEPGPFISAIPDWESRLLALSARCAPLDMTLVAGIPSWLLVVFERIARARGVRAVSAAWPNLRLVLHGGHHVEPFIASLGAHLRPETWMMEVYPASEAFIAMGSRPWRLGEGAPPALELLTDHGVLLEFCPQGGGPHDCVGAAGLEAGGIYRVLVTTPGGLVRYQVGDLVRADGPGLVRVAGRIRTRISVFGEHVEGFELAQALAAACSATAAEVAYYHVAPLLPTESEPRGAHQWLVAFTRPPQDAQVFIGALDRYLLAHVLDYAAHRRGDGQLLAPRLAELPSRAFTDFLAGSGRCDAQRKMPQAWPDRTIADQLFALAQEKRL